MGSNFRHRKILDQARKEGLVTVEGLASKHKVTVQTIRRDLSELAETGRLERVHGGAVIPSGVINIVYEERRRLNEKGKKAIAAACAAMIPDGASVFLNIGTTTEGVARALLDHENLLVVTNNLNIANILAANHSCEIILAGGVLRRADGGIVGGLTVEMVKQFKFDYSILGCSAIDTDGDLLDFDGQEVIVSNTAIARSRQVLCVADHLKFERKAPLTICALSDVDALITDAVLPPELLNKCAVWGTQIAKV
ncbi:DeoR/GlpR family DNA-binding transcription regulator [Sulfitobacter donghicola]|uniref:DeoR faimly transcriptional regulator n=1 Tax=Sulfitobacter donghicola DSW-25 = KCTC 12864 = JCM 14565 TaxID=1300350 RepID=A0A073IHC6_9RHOB|nr:DeoR/GlpR family DNA-binding transcription regulator [Sulfitobacter donghicola]KEJ88950.1 DeoR faimly transcriptional regulator [Sulfitobacter donghicola DSW-25 = KCTC 12864 = JCM 14565]KIN67504.1 Glycerol-3-phosphate regulon repressor GlpR, DeoR family [Sulfitobacter donghicola DSW-25 = KCTC 12864 = JCM 14565]